MESGLRMYLTDKDCIFETPEGIKCRDLKVKDLSMRSYRSLLEKFHNLSTVMYPEVTPAEAMSICFEG